MAYDRRDRWPKPGDSNPSPIRSGSSGFLGLLPALDLPRVVAQGAFGTWLTQPIEYEVNHLPKAGFVTPAELRHAANSMEPIGGKMHDEGLTGFRRWATALGFDSLRPPNLV
jgi:hypothetical protein